MSPQKSMGSNVGRPITTAGKLFLPISPRKSKVEKSRPASSDGLPEVKRGMPRVKFIDHGKFLM